MAKTAFEQKKYASEQQRLAAESLKGAGQRGIQALQAGRGQQLSAFRDQEQASRSLIQQQASQALGGALAGAPRTGMGARLGAAQSTTGATTRAMLGLEADIAGQRAAAAMGFGQQMAGAEAQAAGMEVQAADILRADATTGPAAEREQQSAAVMAALQDQNVLSKLNRMAPDSAIRRATFIEALAGQYSDEKIQQYLRNLAEAFRQAAAMPTPCGYDRIAPPGVALIQQAYAAGMGV